MTICVVGVSGEDNSTNRMQYMIDSAEEVANLPTDVAPLSSAITNTGDLYVLGTDQVWRQW